MIQRKVKNLAPRRQKEDLIEKHKKIGELLELEKVPLHVLSWKEPRYELGDGDCYPLVDVIEKIAELLDVRAKAKYSHKDMVVEIQTKKPGRPKKG